MLSNLASEAMRSVTARPFLSINGLMRMHPLKTSIIVTSAKAGLADLLVQTAFERRAEVDKRRLSVFLLFGAGYQGCIQYWFVNGACELFFPGRALRPLLQKILAINLLVDPLCFFPCFYTLNEALARYPQEALSLDTVHAALSKYYANCLLDWRNSWGVWLPGHAVTFGLLPPHLRMPWISAASFGYVSLLSFTRGDCTTTEPPPTPLVSSLPLRASCGSPQG